MSRGMTWQACRGPVAAVAALAVVSFLVAMEAWTPHEGFVRELTVSGGVINDADKLQDLRLAPVVIGAQFALIVGLGVGAFNLLRIGTLMFWLLAGGLLLYLLWALPNNMPLLLFGSLGLSAGAAFYLSKSHWQDISGQFILAAAGAASAAHHLFGFSPAWGFVLSLPIACFAALLIGPAAAIWSGSAGSAVVALVVGLSAPFFWFDGPDTGISLLDVVHALFSVAIVAETARVLRRYLKLGDDELSTSGLGVATAILVMTAPVVSSAWIPIDDYHFGEKLLAAQAMFDEGGFFVSFFSPHGLSDAAGAVVARLQGDLTGAGIAVGEQVVRWYVAGLLIWLLVQRLGPIPAIGFALVLPSNGKLLLLALNLVLASQAMALRKAWLAGALGAGVAVAGVFINSGLGAASAVVAGVAGLILHGRRGRRSLLRFAASGSVTGLILVVLFWSEVAGQLHFLRVSTASNTTIFGNGDVSVILDHWRRFIYVLAPLLAIALAAVIGAAERDQGTTKRVATLVAIIAPGTILALVLNQYAVVRLDSAGPRGMITTAALLVFLPVWLSLLLGRARIPLSVSAVCILLVLAVTQGAMNLRPSLLPPDPLGPRVQIAEDMPRLGTGRADAAHLAMLRDVRDVVDAILDPGETFLNFTNRNSFYFYFDRPNPVPIASSYNAAPDAFQRDFIAALGDTPPALALVQIENFEHDGLSLPLRSYLLYEFLIENYQPFARGNYVYAVRKDLEARINRLAPEERSYRIGNYTDRNWQNGIATGANARQWSFAVPPSLRGLLRPGDRLVFSDGQERRVTRVEGTKVRTEPTLTHSQDPQAEPLAFSLMDRELLPTNLWAYALHRRWLGRIPSAWGRSMENLRDRLRATGIRPNMVFVADAMTDPERQAGFTVTGSDPRWVFALPEPISPDQAGLLELSIACGRQDIQPLVQVFWRSSRGNFSEEASLRFEASFVNNLIPLDSSPYWSVLPDIAEVRVDVANAESCTSVDMEVTGFYDRE